MSDQTNDLQEKLDNMSELGYKVTTLADLVNVLAGQPPMIEVLVDADGTPMYLNGLEIGELDGRSPFLILKASVTPRIYEAEKKSYEERVDEQRQKAMHMGAVSEESTRMHRRVE